MVFGIVARSQWESGLECFHSTRHGAGEAFVNHFQSIFGQIQGGEFFAAKPADCGGVVCGLEFSTDAATEKINQHVVVLHAAAGVAQDAVVDAQQLAGFDSESGFFAGLAEGCLADQLADFQHASGDRPLGLQRRVSALYENHAGVFDDDGADADQRLLGIFTLHGAGILKGIWG
jgi:hypothetical protein